MKKIADKELRIKIINKNVTINRKSGYLTFDERGRNIGIVFMSDDKRTARYGGAEIMFFDKYEKEFGQWRIIKQNGQYLPFARLEKILSMENQYSCITDSRLR